MTTTSTPSPSRTWRRLALVVVVVCGIFARRYLAETSFELRPLTRHGIEGFLRYVWGDYTGAARAYRAHLREFFETAGLKVRNEQVALAQGDVQQARTLATGALERDRRALPSLLTLGEVALEDGSPRDAVGFIDRALEVVPDDTDALLLATVAHARAEDYPGAIRAIDRALRDWHGEHRVMTFVRVLGETGRLYALGDRRPACLLAFLHRYLRIYDESQGRLAIARAEEAIAHGDQPDDAYVTIGVVHQKRAEDAQALEALLQAIEINPHNAEAYRWASVVYAERGDLVNQYRTARAAYDIAPGDPAYSMPLAILLTDRLGDYRTALEIDRKLLASGRETPALLDHLGYLHGVLGHADDAVAFYQRAVASAPRDPSHLRGLGWAYLLEDRSDEAIDGFRRALAIAPYWTETRQQLAIAYRRLGRYDDAIPELERAYLENPALKYYLPDLCITYQLAAHFDRARACADEFLSRSGQSPDMSFLRSFTLSDALAQADAR